MALADYRLCDICYEKTFYDANLDYDDSGKLDRVGDWRIICPECAKKFKVEIVPIEQGEDALAAAKERERALVDALEDVVDALSLHGGSFACDSFNIEDEEAISKARAALARVKEVKDAE